jgi:hypothetical protein
MVNAVYILVADRAGARLFRYTVAKSKPAFQRTWTCPMGRLRNRDINADKPGHSMSSRGSGWFPLMNRTQPTDQVRIRWASQLARILRRINKSEPSSYILVSAEAKLLGEIKKDLDTSLLSTSFMGVPKDLGHFREQDLWSHLMPFVHEAIGRPEWLLSP